MLDAKAFVRDGEELLAGTCNLEAWSLKRFFEIDLQVWSKAVASQFDERFSAPAEAVSSPGRRLTGTQERAKASMPAVVGFQLLAAVAAGFAFTLTLRARYRDALVMCSLTVLALSANEVRGTLFGQEAAVFVAALTVGTVGGLAGSLLRRSPLVFISRAS
jgi:hypothetical protein